VNPKPLRHVDIHSSAGRLEALYRELQDPAAVAAFAEEYQRLGDHRRDPPRLPEGR